MGILHRNIICNPVGLIAINIFFLLCKKHLLGKTQWLKLQTSLSKPIIRPDTDTLDSHSRKRAGVINITDGSAPFTGVCASMQHT